MTAVVESCVVPVKLVGQTELVDLVAQLTPNPNWLKCQLVENLLQELKFVVAIPSAY